MCVRSCLVESVVGTGQGVKLAEFNGSKSVSCLSSSMLRLNPDEPRAHQLRGWYDNGGAALDSVNISARYAAALRPPPSALRDLNHTI